MGIKDKPADVQSPAVFAAAWNLHALEAPMGFMTDDAELRAVGGTDLRGSTCKPLPRAKAFSRLGRTFRRPAWLGGDLFLCGTQADGLRDEAPTLNVFTLRGGKNAYR